MTKGERIRGLRISKNISQTELADMIGQSKQTVYKYETNIVTNIPSDVIEKIALALGTTPSYIFGWDEIAISSTEIDNKDIFAKNLSYYMEKKQVDRYQLCEALDFKYSTLCEWLSAKKYPRIDKIEKMANYFGIPKSALIEKSEPVKTDPLSEFKLSAKQRELLEMLLTLDQETLDKTLDFARFLLSQRDKNE